MRPQDSYVLGASLGQGGFGEVFCRQPQIGQGGKDLRFMNGLPWRAVPARVQTISC